MAAATPRPVAIALITSSFRRVHHCERAARISASSAARSPRPRLTRAVPRSSCPQQPASWCAGIAQRRSRLASHIPVDNPAAACPHLPPSRCSPACYPLPCRAAASQSQPWCQPPSQCAPPTMPAPRSQYTQQRQQPVHRCHRRQHMATSMQRRRQQHTLTPRSKVGLLRGWEGRCRLSGLLLRGCCVGPAVQVSLGTLNPC